MADLGKVGWIFDGGGFLCAYGVGMAKACWEKGIKPDYIQCVSGGVFSAAKIIESQDIKELEKIWLEVEDHGPNAIFNKRGMLLRLGKNSLFSNHGIWQLLKRLDMEKIAGSPTELEVILSNESKDNQTEFFSNQKLKPEDYEDFKKALCATTALMGFLPPVKIKNQIFSDGLHIDVRRALQKGCDTVFIFSNIRTSALAGDPESTSWYWRLRNCLRIVINREMRSELNSILKENEDLIIQPNPSHSTEIVQLREKFSRRKSWRRRIIYINPAIMLPTLEIITFSQGDIRKAIDHGYRTARETARNLMG